MVDIYVDNHTQQDFQVDIRDCAGVGSIKNGPVNRGTTDSWRFKVHDGPLHIGSNIYRVNVSAIGEGANPRNNFWFGLSTDWKGGCDVRIVLTPYGPVGTTVVDYVLRYTPDSLPS